MHKSLAILLLFLTPLGAFAQSAIWEDVKPNSIALSGPRRIVPKSYRTVRLNKDALMQLLAQAPMEFTEAKRDRPRYRAVAHCFRCSQRADGSGPGVA